MVRNKTILNIIKNKRQSISNILKSIEKTISNEGIDVSMFWGIRMPNHDNMTFRAVIYLALMGLPYYKGQNKKKTLAIASMFGSAIYGDVDDALRMANSPLDSAIKIALERCAKPDLLQTVMDVINSEVKKYMDNLLTEQKYIDQFNLGNENVNSIHKNKEVHG
jgi:hypothetical protein